MWQLVDEIFLVDFVGGRALLRVRLLLSLAVFFFLRAHYPSSDAGARRVRLEAVASDGTCTAGIIPSGNAEMEQIIAIDDVAWVAADARRGWLTS